ncbi:hypothetical protein CFP56_002970 [Quercus suber]|uniref:Uncharacterized protein n=1 Tax=Quercus suber TaxID=58331 RepID=A0AAW0LDH1_QUESU
MTAWTFLLSGTICASSMMRLYDGVKEILKIQKFRRIVSYTGFYCFAALVSYAYTSNTTRAGYSRADQFYASYPAGTELLTDTAKLHLAIALKWKSGVRLSIASWRNTLSGKGNRLTHIMHNTWHTFSLMVNLMEVAKRKFECSVRSGTVITF